jgi:enoyl-CoA hydratase/carnithine racemase
VAQVPARQRGPRARHRRPLTTADTILVEVDGGVATIVLNRPDRLNAITAPMGVAFDEAVRRADEDPDVRAIVLTGAGRGFCGGSDLGYLAEESAGDQTLTPDDGMHPGLLLQVCKPVVAAVNGPAAGLGFVLMLMADVRFVAADATLTSSFARLGLVAEYGCAWLLPRMIGLPAALDVLLTGRRLTGQDAVALGLAQQALPPADVLPAAQDYARAMATQCSPHSMAVIKSQVYGDLTRSFPDSLERATELMVSSFGLPDVAEGLEAQKERRQPNFAPQGHAELPLVKRSW